MGLRSIPGLAVIRPADATETAEAWQTALQRRDGPTALILTRQNVPVLAREALSSAGGAQHGGYSLREAAASPDIILIGTGSEVHIALEAGELLREKGVAARIVSLPSWELFDGQPEEYRNKVLLPGVPRVSIEAGITLGWERYTGSNGVAIGLSRFGASAPGKVIYEQLGLTAQRMADEALNLLQGGKK